jgi:peptide-methionine (R)-S-oxide reductase
MSFMSSIISQFSSKTPSMTYADQRSPDEWQAVLNKGRTYLSGSSADFSSSWGPSSDPFLLEQFRILREKGTEAPFSGEYDQHFPEEGVYGCAGCNAPLYKANHKFKSGCGWPAYFDSIPGAVTRHEDRMHGMLRTEIVCTNCGGHLGHVFKGEGYQTPTDERHCVNSVSLRFTPKDGPAAKESKA